MAEKRKIVSRKMVLPLKNEGGQMENKNPSILKKYSPKNELSRWT